MPYEYVYLFLVGSITSFIATPFFRKLALSLNITDHPSDRKIHRQPVPYLGGLSFHCVFSVGLLFLFLFMPYTLGQTDTLNHLILLYLIATAFLILGIIDDIYSISASIKLVIQSLLCIILVAFGFSITQMTSPFGGIIPLGWFGTIVSFFWILTIVNAINFIDGLDGLAGGVVFFAALANLLISLFEWQNYICLVSLLLMAGVLGFLPFNFSSKKKIFMGDAGSLYLGVWLAGSSLESNVKSSTVMSLSLPLVILSIPLLDALLTIVRRGRKGRHFFKADREHIHHRIIRLGFSDLQAVCFLYGLCFLLSMSAVLAAQLPNRYSFLFIFVFLAAITWGLIVFNAFENRLIGSQSITPASESPAPPRKPQ